VLVIIAVNILLFIAAVISGKVFVTNNGVTVDVMYELNYYMGLIPNALSERPWTIITSMFAHADFFHIFSNMLVLFFFGRIVYKVMGGWRFLLVYFIGGIAGNLLYLWIGPSSSIALGASGAVYAIAGTLVVLMPNMRVALWGIIPMPLWIFAIVFLGLLSIPPFAGPNIAWQAHMGGLVVGLAAGLIFKRQMRYVIYR
jgi:membrane associated rhomboid family serine protease